jgi:endo-1,3(4)-beta-glucanase
MKARKNYSNRKARTKLLLIAIVLAVGIALILVVRFETDKSTQLNIDTSLLQSLKQQTNPSLQPTHLAANIVPPTNRWYSGIVFPSTPQPIYPLPLSFKPTATGFAFGLPTVTATANTVFGSYNPALTLTNGSDSYTVTHCDAVSVTLAYTLANQPVANVTIAEGSPFVSYEAESSHTLQLGATFAKQAAGTYSVVVGGVTYGLYTTAAVSGDTVRMQAHDTAVLFPVAQGMTATDMSAFAHQPLQSVKSSYGAHDSLSNTTLTYQAAGAKTLFAALPDQQITTGQKLAGTYNTIYGRLQLYAGNSFSFSVPEVTASDTLDLGNLDQAKKQELIDQLKVDAAGTQLAKTDSYYGGKELYRAANLYQLALQLGQKDVANGLHTQLMSDMNEWFDPGGSKLRDNRYFYYDTTIKGLVAAQPSFGSELFNDHHFHYGYFLYAAAIVASHDTSFKDSHEAFLNLIASDIAAPASSRYFPQQRLFDPYSGHAWASGDGNFADGNNQESSSEAVNAWNGVSLWGKVSGNSALQASGTWMLSREAATSIADWTNINTAQAPFSNGYQHSIVSLNWGGKRDYATFFSPDPNAILGIQLIPLNPAMGYLRQEAVTIPAKVAEALPGGDYNKQFADYLLMYQSLSDTPDALTRARTLDSAYIDDANSRSYMLAWIMARHK